MAWNVCLGQRLRVFVFGNEAFRIRKELGGVVIEEEGSHRNIQLSYRQQGSKISGARGDNQMPNPRDFFERIVRPSYEEWLSDPLSEWKAKAAVANADTMAERLFAYWHSRDPGQVAGATSASKYRSYLRESVCSDFGLVWDVHDGHKHMTLSRANREVSTSDQTGVGRMGFGEGGFGEGDYGGDDQIVIQLDDGSKRVLSAVMLAVMKMWETTLATMKL